MSKIWIAVTALIAMTVSGCKEEAPPAPEARPPPFALHELFERPFASFVIQAELLKPGSDI